MKSKGNLHRSSRGGAAHLKPKRATGTSTSTRATGKSRPPADKQAGCLALAHRPECQCLTGIMNHWRESSLGFHQLAIDPAYTLTCKKIRFRSIQSHPFGDLTTPMSAIHVPLSPYKNPQVKDVITRTAARQWPHDLRNRSSKQSPYIHPLI